MGAEGRRCVAGLGRLRVKMEPTIMNGAREELTIALHAGDVTLHENLRRMQAQIEYQEERLQAMAAAARSRGEEVAALRQQLQAFAVDFRNVHRSERARMQELTLAQEETALRLLKASRLRDEDTGTHIWRVALYTRLFCRYLGSPPGFSEVLFRAAPLHDVGKIGIPDAVLRKNGALDETQWAMMREHTRIGAQVLDGSPSPLLQMACRVAMSHHEHYDGSGYPNHLMGEQIPLEGRIVKLADTYDALRMKRPYKPPYDHDRALATILEGDGRTRPSHFDPELLAIFIRTHEEFDRVFRDHDEQLHFEE